MTKFVYIMFFIYTFFFCQAMANTTQFPGVVYVSSEYKDESSRTGEMVTLEGIGIIINVNARYFIVTAAHLSQGKKLMIKSAQKDNVIFNQTKNNRRFADNNIDIEVIEVEDPKDSSLVTFTKPTGKAYGGMHYDYLLTESSNIDTTTLSNVANNLFIPTLNKKNIITNLLQDVDKKREFILKYNLLEAKTYSGDWFTLDFRIVPGMSGSPLIEFDENKKAYLLKGIATGFSKFMQKSVYASFTRISSMITYLSSLPINAKTPKLSRPTDAQSEHTISFVDKYSNPTWKYSRSDGFYRDYGYGLYELDLNDIAASGGDPTEGGEDTSLTSFAKDVNNLRMGMIEISGNGESQVKKGIIGFKLKTFENNAPIIQWFFANHLNKISIDRYIKNNPNLRIEVDFLYSEEINLHQLILTRLNNSELISSESLNYNSNYGCMIEAPLGDNFETLTLNVRNRYDNSTSTRESTPHFHKIVLSLKDMQNKLGNNSLNTYIKVDNDFYINIIGLFMTNLMFLGNPDEFFIERILDFEHTFYSLIKDYSHVFYESAFKRTGVPVSCVVVK